jgi:hypothetical protein
MMSFRILGGVLTLAEGHVRRLHEDPGAHGPGPLEMGAAVPYSHQDRVRDPLGSRWLTVVMGVGDNDCAIAELQLRAVVLADLHPLGKSECVSQPSHRGSDI